MIMTTKMIMVTVTIMMKVDSQPTCQTKRNMTKIEIVVITVNTIRIIMKKIDSQHKTFAEKKMILKVTLTRLMTILFCVT